MPIEPGQGDASREHTPYTDCRGALAGGHDAELISRARPDRTREKGMSPQVPWRRAPTSAAARGQSARGGGGEKGLERLVTGPGGQDPMLVILVRMF